MSDIFLHDDIEDLLLRKRVVIIGDSNMRGLYKDIVCLLHKNEILTAGALRSKLEPSFLDDNLLNSGTLHNGRDYREERQFVNQNHNVCFFFVTKCYDKYFEDKIIKNFNDSQPDVVIMNSCLWDITRWGPNGVDKYKENLAKLMKRLREILKPNCLFIWTTTMPISQDMKGGFLIPQVEFLRHQLRFETMEANLFAWNTVSKNGFDVLDLHYYMQMNISRREKDGIHWINIAMRHVTNYVLTHIALAWDFPLPGRIKNSEMNNMISTPLYPEFPQENEQQQAVDRPKKKVLRPFRRLNDPRSKRN